MAFDWKAYLDLATELKDQIPPEPDALTDSKLRCGISRAYYAVFNIAKEYLMEVEAELCLNMARRQHEGQRFNREDIERCEKALRSVHAHVQRSFRKATGDRKKDQIRQSVSQILAELCDERVEADYKGDYSPKVATLKKQITDANTLLNYINQLVQLNAP